MSLAVALEQFATEARELLPWIGAHRRHLHRNPELSFHEEKTSLYLREEVRKLGLEPSEPLPGRHGFHVDLIAPANPGRFILLRADMDALPIQEENKVDFISTCDGVGHLCGHDVHTSMLLGALHLLKDRAAALPVSVRFVFQHAEEVAPGGATDFVAAGLTEDVLGCFGIHVSPRVPLGQFGLRTGETMAGAGAFSITMRGKGGHGAAPHEAIDPMPASAQAILALQQIVARRLPPTEAGVVSVCYIEGGKAFNVIPQTVRFGGTFRSFVPGRCDQIGEMIKETVENTARAWGCEAEVQLQRSYPPVLNNEAAIGAARDTMHRLFGPDSTVDIAMSMGAEDFSYFALSRPSAFVFLGVLRDEDPFRPLHHPEFLPQESVMWMGSAYLAAIPFIAPDYLPKEPTTP